MPERLITNCPRHYVVENGDVTELTEKLRAGVGNCPGNSDLAIRVILAATTRAFCNLAGSNLCPALHEGMNLEVPGTTPIARYPEAGVMIKIGLPELDRLGPGAIFQYDRSLFVTIPRPSREFPVLAARWDDPELVVEFRGANTSVKVLATRQAFIDGHLDAWLAIKDKYFKENP